MNDLEPKTRIEVKDESDQRIEKRFIGSMVIPKGCDLYSFDVKSRIFEKVPVKSQHRLDPKSKTISATKKAEYSDSAIYVKAINPKNAARKINKILAKSRIPLSIKLTK